MSENERDTHFQDFAKLLWKELLELNGYGYIDVSDAWCTDCGEHEPYINHIAQRAYDLARHIVWEAMGGTPNAITIILSDVPDLTEWPTEPQQSAVPGSSSEQSPPEVA